MAFLARWSTTHCRTVIAAWVVLLLASLGTAGTLKNRFSNNLTLLPGTGAQRASDLLRRHFPALAGDTDQIVFHARRGTLIAPEAVARVKTALTSVNRLPHVTGVTRLTIAPERTIGFATVTFDRRGDALPTDAVERVMTTTHRAYDLLSAGFGPGFNGPLHLAVRTGDRGSLARLTNALRRTEGVASVAKPHVNADGDTAAIAVLPTTAPQSKQTYDLVERLRDDVIPATGLTAYVGGSTASQADLAHVLSRKLRAQLGGGPHRRHALPDRGVHPPVVIRSILLPAVLELFGPATWAFPRWADRVLPRLAIEPGRADADVVQLPTPLPTEVAS